MNITEVLVPSQAIAWLPWAVQYFFYIGSAYAWPYSLIALLFERRSSHRLRAALALTLAIGAMVGPLALTAICINPAERGTSTLTSRRGRGCRWARCFCRYFQRWLWRRLGFICAPI